jgi:CheY-like chemotaxis protein/HPt (histidine-containing phosphotransfer) domain-containing protein
MENDMLQDFFIEAEELFDEAEDSLLSIEKTDNFLASFNSIFRAFHSVKGAAGMFGIEALQQHMHYVESLLETRKSDTNLTVVMVDYLLSAIDGAKILLKGGAIDFEYYDPDSNKSKPVPVVDTEVKESIRKEVTERLSTKINDGLIFLVDDEPEILAITQEYLESKDFRVKTFSNANLALAELKVEVPDLIISDIKMPEMNGIEFVKEVNKVKPHLPVIVVSGFVTKEVCLEALSCGVSGVLEKPFDPDTLISTVQFLINRYQNAKLLNQSIDLLVQEFEGFDKFLLSEFGEDKRDSFRKDLKHILKTKKILFDNLN